jgi:hypothetical protein
MEDELPAVGDCAGGPEVRRHRLAAVMPLGSTFERPA